MSERKAFLDHVLEGLRQKPKKISSLYFYDTQGSKIFQKIMNMPEYYLPGLEKALLVKEAKTIAARFKDEPVTVIELGAGDGSKTRILLESLSMFSGNVTYVPLDIDLDVLEENKLATIQAIKGIQVKSIAGNYFQTLSEAVGIGGKKLLLFMGSNLGNFDENRTRDFLKMIYDHLGKGDYFLLAVDLKKDPKKIAKAYDDPHGITAKFNLNLLVRINRELQGDFRLDQFEHYASYNPLSGLAQSFLVSKKKQKVQIAGQFIEFEAGEVIHTENSRKYALPEIKQLLENEGFLINPSDIFEQEGYGLVLAGK